MEYNILSGNNVAESSERADQDDMFGEILNKYGTASKSNKSEQILTKENAQQACSELYETKKGLDGYDAAE